MEQIDRDVIVALEELGTTLERLNRLRTSQHRAQVLLRVDGVDFWLQGDGNVNPKE